MRKTANPKNLCNEFRVGLSGHRWDRLDQALEPRIKLLLADVFRELEAKYSTDLSKNARFILVTGLAEGTDQIGAEMMPSHWHLEALLALPKDAFIRHLLREGTGTEKDRKNAAKQLAHFLGREQTKIIEPEAAPKKSKNAANFGELRDKLIERIDVLVAVWDGNKEIKPGGTFDVIQYAELNGIPTTIIDSKNLEKNHLQ